MADAIVSIALERLADITEEKIGEEINLIKGVKEEVLSLSSELTAIKNVVEDAEKRGFKDKSIQNWLKKLEDISYDVDDVLDEWNFAILKLQIEGAENFVGPKLKVPQGFEQLTALRTLRLFTGTGSSKLGYLKKLNQLSGSLELRIHLHRLEDVKEAQKAELRNKKHIETLIIWFFNRVEGSNEEQALLKHEAMEALRPHPNLQSLTILEYHGTKFPDWITSSLNYLKSLRIEHCDYCSTLPPLGKLPCLEKLSMWRMDGLEFLNREFLGISGNSDGSMPSSAVVIGFPKLKILSFELCYKWKEWEDITAEEATDSALSIMPCLKELEIKACKLMALPHQLLRKASALENLKIEDSLYLSQRYEDKNGSGWSSLSHIPHVKVEYIRGRSMELL